MTLSDRYTGKFFFYISLSQGFAGGLVLIYISRIPFQYQYRAYRGFTLLSVYIAIIVTYLILVKFLVPHYLPYIKRVGYGLISFIVALIPFLIFETVYTSFAYKKTFWDVTSVILMLTGIGLIISLIFSIFIKRKKINSDKNIYIFPDN
jgi:hypothetical protein